MKRKLLVVLGLVAIAAFGATGCARDQLDGSKDRLSFSSLVAPGGASMAKPDSTPGGPPPKPPPIPPVQFAGSDLATAGQLVVTRWLLGNDGNSALTTDWVLTDGAGWPDLPIEGSLFLPPKSTQLLEVAVQVPDSAAHGTNPLHMTVTLRGNRTASADGFIQVVSDSIPPDSLRHGGDG